MRNTGSGSGDIPAGTPYFYCGQCTEVFGLVPQQPASALTAGGAAPVDVDQRGIRLSV